MRYQIVYCKRGWPLTTWADNADRARKLAEQLRKDWLFRRCVATHQRRSKKPTFNPPDDGLWRRPKRPAGRRGSHPLIHDILEVLAMENKNMTAAREWENDPNCFLRMLNSPAQQRSRAARRQKDADRERFNNVLNAVAIGAATFAVTLLVICFVL